MSGPILLPAPVAATSFSLGQLLSDPLEPSCTSFPSVSQPDLNEPHTYARFNDVVSHDDEGRFISSLSGRSFDPYTSLVLVQADQMEYTSLRQPTRSFNLLRKDPAVQSYLRTLALRNEPLYYVVGVQKLKNPTFKHATVREGSIAEVRPDNKIRLPMHTRRDSSMDLQEGNTEAVLGLELRKVRCHVGSPEEPHALEDIGYSWTYHTLDSDPDLQLSIGLGKMLEAAELRSLTGIVSDEDFTDESHDDYSDDDEGHGGF